MPLRIEERDQACVFEVRVSPRSRRNRVVGPLGSAIKVRVAAPPEHGAANQALIEFLASLLGVKNRDVQILTGHGARTKRICVSGITAEEVKGRLLR